VLLSGNPGFSEQDKIWHDRPEFRRAAMRSLLHRYDGYAHYLLDPRFEQASGAQW
jgi:hypothetical protein